MLDDTSLWLVAVTAASWATAITLGLMRRARPARVTAAVALLLTLYCLLHLGCLVSYAAAWPLVSLSHPV